MSLLHVEAPGLLTTVQDLGRPGFGPAGVSPSGAADPLSLRLGNRLVGNPETAAALEMTLLGGTFAFPDGAVCALAGSDFGRTLDHSSVKMWTSFQINPGQTLRVGPTRSGARCYLCIRGGISVKPFLGSASTHLLSGLGGHQGRALRQGDLLTIGRATGRWSRREISASMLERLSPQKLLRVTPGPQQDWFPLPSRKLFHSSPYRVTEECNRMGLRLDGPSVAPVPGREMVTEGVSLGAVQITPDGQPIILFVEQQTTGGYAKIANVISADLPSLGQLRPRDEIRFELVSWEYARRSLVEQETLLSSEDLILE